MSVLDAGTRSNACFAPLLLVVVACASAASPEPAMTPPAVLATEAPSCAPDHTIKVGDLDIEYETFGDPKRPALLLVMGLGSQMIYWDDDLCRALADRGFHVVRFDNRDIGRSTKLAAFGAQKIHEGLGALLTGRVPVSAYLLSDMAGDAVGLLDALGLPAAHVVGISMGGMIAQELAIRHPTRVLSLVSIMSTTGDPSIPRPSTDVALALLQPPPPERERYVAHVVRLFGVIGSGPVPFDREWLARTAARSWDRCHDHEGGARQLLAIAASGSRKEALAAVTAPTLVIHGDADPLVPLAGGQATANAIPGAKLLVLPGVAHALPRAVWPQVLDAIAENAARPR